MLFQRITARDLATAVLFSVVNSVFVLQPVLRALAGDEPKPTSTQKIDTQPAATTIPTIRPTCKTTLTQTAPAW